MGVGSVQALLRALLELRPLSWEPVGGTGRAHHNRQSRPWRRKYLTPPGPGAFPTISPGSQGAKETAVSS